MKVRDLLSLLPRDVEYRGDLDADFGGLTVRFDGRNVAGKFCVMVSRKWGRAVADKYQFASEEVPDRIAQALGRGAVGFVLPRQQANDPAVEQLNRFVVDDTNSFAYAAAAAVRDSRGDRRITAITGSAGKSTTKAMVTHAIRHLVPADQVYSPGSTQNVAVSQIGHLTVSDRFTHSVIEVAGSCFKIFRQRGFTVSPDVSVVTNISEAHLTYLKDLRTVAEEKSHLFEGPPPGGTAVINLDTPHADVLVQRAVRAGCQLVTYGESPDATIRLRRYDGTTRTVTAELGSESITYKLGADGYHMAINSLAVIAVLRAHRFNNWRAGVESLATFAPLKGRGRVSELDLPKGGKATLIDDAYNANPASMRAALEMLHSRASRPGGRKVAVLGDILELGDDAESIHLGLTDAIEAGRFDTVHFVGEHMGKVHAALHDRLPDSAHWIDLDALAEALTTSLADGDTVLLKGSNGTGLHRVVDQLTR